MMKAVARISLAALLFALAASRSVHAVPTIETGTFTLQPNTANQAIQIYAHGADSVSAITFEAQTGDGGPFSFGTAGGLAPTISAINLLPPGGVFNTSNANPQTGGPLTDPNVPNPDRSKSQVWEVGTSAFAAANVGTGDSVAAHQLLATITIDTTGFFAGSFALKFLHTYGGDTTFSDKGGDLPVNAPDGVLTIAPEPSSLALLTLGASALLFRRRRSCGAALPRTTPAIV